MLSFLYEICIGLFALICVPKVFYERYKYGKYKESVIKRFGFDAGFDRLDQKSETVWIHAVSVGEVRAVSTLVKKLHEQYPKLRFVFSTITETGQAEAKRILPFINHYCYLPFDLSWVVKRALNKVQPKLVIICETDFWYNFLRYAKSVGAKTLLVNGKISKGSHKNFKRFSFFAKKLFSFIDHLCLQNDEYYAKFASLGIPKSKLSVTGNIKFDIEVPQLSDQAKRKWWDTLGSRKILTIGSTHQGEEEALLKSLLPLLDEHPNYLIVLVPRHPERFPQVAAALKSMQVPFVAWSENKKCTEETKVFLLDTMGQLLSAYQLSKMAIVAGSFIQGVGGHNVCEPSFYGVPSIFGPYTENQKELVEIALDFKAGLQVKLDDINAVLNSLICNKELMDDMGAQGKALSEEMRGATQRSLEHVLELNALNI